MRGAWSSRQVRFVPILILCWCGARCAAMAVDSIFMPDDESDWVGTASSAGLQEGAWVFFPSKLLLMPLAISIAFAIIHYRKGRFNLKPPKGLS